MLGKAEVEGLQNTVNGEGELVNGYNIIGNRARVTGLGILGLH